MKAKPNDSFPQENKAPIPKVVLGLFLAALLLSFGTAGIMLLG